MTVTVSANNDIGSDQTTLTFTVQGLYKANLNSLSRSTYFKGESFIMSGSVEPLTGSAFNFSIFKTTIPVAVNILYYSYSSGSGITRESVPSYAFKATKNFFLNYYVYKIGYYEVCAVHPSKQNIGEACETVPNKFYVLGLLFFKQIPDSTSASAETSFSLNTFVNETGVLNCK